MSCGGGNQFSCSLRRFDKHKIASDRPSNQQLHNENEKKLTDLLKIREEQDKGIFTANIPTSHELYTPWQQSNHPFNQK